ncbi:MAG: peptidase S41 [Cytophagales bacterium]|nr:peptidase S41 [Cytophagales bacterium]
MLRSICLLSTLLCCLLGSTGSAAQTPNLDFESLATDGRKPAGWDVEFKNMGASGYLIRADSLVRQHGRYALSLEPDPAAPHRTFGACDLSLPAHYEGKRIELKGYLKLEAVTGGFAGLWLRQDGEAGALAFDNMQKENLHGTKDWQPYSISLPLHEDTKTIHLGALLTGKGKVWVDNLEVLIDGKPLAKASPKVVRLSKAGQDTVFNGGSKVQLAQLTPGQAEHLAVLGKVWGFLKYYHPAVGKGDHNWDAELFRVLPRVLESKDKTDRSQVLLDWIAKLGEIAPCRTCGQPRQELAKLEPELGWLSDGKLFTPALADKLVYIKNNRHQGRHYYVGMVPNIGNPDFKHEHAYAHLKSPDAGYRLLALFRYWNIIEYFFPYKYAIGEDWNQVLAASVPRFVAANDSLSYRLAALELIGRVHDTHANLWGNEPVLEAYRGKFHAPVKVQFVEDQAVVTDVLRADSLPLRKGDVITHIDGTGVEELVRRQLPLTPASNHATKLRDLSRRLLRGHSPEVTLRVERAGARFETRLPRYPAGEVNMARLYGGNVPDSSYRLLSPHIGYIYPGNIKTSQLPAMFAHFRHTRGLVIDLRCYPSEFVVFSLGKYLMPRPTEFVKFSKGDVNNPGLFTYTRTLRVGHNNPDHYKGKVVILVNETTQSQAEYTTMAFRVSPQATVMGSTTAGADGDVSGFALPGNLRTMISGIGVYYPDGKETQRVGIVPDIEAKPTIEGIRAGRDEVLEKAIHLIESATTAAGNQAGRKE